MQTAAEWRRRAEALTAQERYTEAAEAYRKEAAIYRKNGDLNGALVEEAKADRWSSEIKLYAHLPDARPPSFGTLGKHEPAYGCYIGAFLDRDERLGSPIMFQRADAPKPGSFWAHDGQETGVRVLLPQLGEGVPGGVVRMAQAAGRRAAYRVGAERGA